MNGAFFLARKLISSEVDSISPDDQSLLALFSYGRCFCVFQNLSF